MEGISQTQKGYLAKFEQSDEKEELALTKEIWRWAGKPKHGFFPRIRRYIKSNGIECVRNDFIYAQRPDSNLYSRVGFFLKSCVDHTPKGYKVEREPKPQPQVRNTLFGIIKTKAYSR